MKKKEDFPAFYFSTFTPTKKRLKNGEETVAIIHEPYYDRTEDRVEAAAYIYCKVEEGESMN